MANRIIAATVLLSVFITSCKNEEKEVASKQDVIPVKTIPLTSNTINQQFTASGQFTTDDETVLSFKTGGVVMKVYVNEGDRVNRGQLLATLNLTEINALVSQAKLGLQKAERDYERANNLYRDSVATLEQLQNAKTALDLAKQQYASAGFNQQYSEIRATTSGFVLRKFVNDGQVVGAGMPILQVNGATNANWSLRAGVSDQQWAALKVGDKATVTSDVAPGKIFEGRVRKKTEGVDMQSGTFVVYVELNDAPRELLASGLFGKATIYPQGQQTAWSIPFDALLDGDAREAWVFVTSDGKTAKKRKVEVSHVDKNAVWISSGLEGVEQLIVSGSAYLNDGSSIVIQNDSTSMK